MTEDVKPTRAEELRLKDQIELAESGHSILEKKRDSLIHEFMELVEDAKDTKGALADDFAAARQALARASALDGTDTLRSLATATSHEPDVELETRNIMGVEVPRVASSDVHVAVDGRGFGTLSGSPAIDDAIRAYEDLLATVLEVAEQETALMKLLDEIDATNRRVNALENRIIPETRDKLDYVSQHLEENAREETFRMKKIKEKNN